MGGTERARGRVVKCVVGDVDEEPLELCLDIMEGFANEEVVVC